MSTLLIEASSLKWRLHYHDKILFRSDDKTVSFPKQRTIITHEGAAKSSMNIVRDTEIYSNVFPHKRIYMSAFI